MLAVVRPLLAASHAPPPERRESVDAQRDRSASSSMRAPSVLDRRGAPRHGARAEERSVDRFTATTHRPLGMSFAIGVDGQWALMTGLTIAPHGILLRALDPADAALEAPARDVLAAWRRLGRDLGPHASPLWFSTACIGARAFVAALADHAGWSASPVLLRPQGDRPGLQGRTFVGRLAALIDPAPDVLGIDLDPVDLALLGAHARPEPPAGRAPGDLDEPAERADAGRPPARPRRHPAPPQSACDRLGQPAWHRR